MNIVDLFENVFWEVATNMAYLIMPLISITLIIKIIHYFIIKVKFTPFTKMNAKIIFLKKKKKNAFIKMNAVSVSGYKFLVYNFFKIFINTSPIFRFSNS